MKSSEGIPCPECGIAGSGVTDCRANEAGIRRRRQCANGHRYSTIEIALHEWQIQLEETIDEVLGDAIRAAEAARDKYRNRNRT